MAKRLGVALMFVLAVSVAGSLRARASRHFFATRLAEDLYYVPRATALPALSLGHRSAFADFLWMRALVYYGEGISRAMPLRHVLDYAQAIRTLDRDFVPVYRFASTAAAYQRVAPPMDDLLRAARFLESGTRANPENGELAWLAGSFWSYEVAPRYAPRSSERRAAQGRGAVFLVSAARRGAGPAWLALSNAGALLRLGERERAIQHMREMAELTRDPEVRARIERQIQHLSSAVEEEARERALHEAQREWQSNYPYLPPMLYELVGPRSILDGTRDPVAP